MLVEMLYFRRGGSEPFWRDKATALDTWGVLGVMDNLEVRCAFTMVGWWGLSSFRASARCHMLCTSVRLSATHAPPPTPNALRCDFEHPRYASNIRRRESIVHPSMP